MIKHPRLLYHFTCRLWWRFIEIEGIRFGEVPIGGGRLLNFPNLTVDLAPANQGWAPPPGDSTLVGGRRIVMALNKRAVRIAIKFSRPDPRLVRWVGLARQTGLDPRILRCLDAVGGGHMDDWWVYRGTISPARFASVEFLDGGEIEAIERRFIEATKDVRSSRHAMNLLSIP